MKLKKFTLFSVREPLVWTLPAETLPYHEIGQHDLMTTGFIESFDDNVFILKKSVKNIPSYVIKEKMAEKISNIEKSESRKISRRERSVIRDEVLFDLVTKAFIKHSVSHGIYCRNEGILIVSETGRKADDFCTRLTQAIGGSFRRICPDFGCRSEMSNWIISGPRNGSIIVLDNCVLSGGDSRISVKGVETNSTEIMNHLSCGKSPDKLLIEIDGEGSFTINDDMEFGQFKFSNVVEEKVSEIDYETKDLHDRATVAIYKDSILSIYKSLSEEMGITNE